MANQTETDVSQRIKDSVSDKLSGCLKEECEASDKSLRSLEKAKAAMAVAAQRSRDADSKSVAFAQGQLSKQQLEVAGRLEARRVEEAKRQILSRHSGDTADLVAETVTNSELVSLQALSDLILHLHLYHQQLGTMAKAVVDQLNHLTKHRMAALENQRQEIQSQRLAPSDLSSKFERFQLLKPTTMLPPGISLAQATFHRSETAYLEKLSQLLDLERDLRSDPRLLSKFGGDNPVEAVFFKLQQMSDLHSKLLAAFERAQQSGAAAAAAAEQQALLEFTSAATDLYQEYATNFARVIHIISQTSTASKSFETFLSSVEGIFGHPLIDLLALPRTRLNYYLQYTQFCVNSDGSFQPVLDQLRVAFAQIQAKNQVSERLVTLYRIQSRLILPPSLPDLKLPEAHRYLIREGSLRLVDNEQLQGLLSSGGLAPDGPPSAIPSATAHMFLFNDSFILARPSGLIGNLSALVGRKAFDDLLGDKLTYNFVDRVNFGSGTSRITVVVDPQVPCCLLLSQAHKSVRLLFPTAEERQIWQSQFSAALQPSATCVFGVPLGQQMMTQGTQRDIPYVLEITSFNLQTHLAEEGIFRLSGQSTMIEQLQLQLDRGEAINLANTDPHAIAGLLKQWLRALPEPLMTSHLFEDFFQLGSRLRPPPSGATRIQVNPDLLHQLSSLICSLPKHNAFVLQHLMFLLSRVAADVDKNKMGGTNLATIFGPTLLCRPGSSPADTSDYGAIFALIRVMIENYSAIFAPIEKLRMPNWRLKIPAPPSSSSVHTSSSHPIPSHIVSQPSVSISSSSSSPSSLAASPYPTSSSTSPAPPASSPPPPALLCAGCQNPITNSGLEALNQVWHPQCFLCRCGAVLADTGFMEIGGKAWCGTCAQKYILYIQQQNQQQSQQQNQQQAVQPETVPAQQPTPPASSPSPTSSSASAPLNCEGCQSAFVKGQRALKVLEKCWHFECFQLHCRCSRCQGDLTKGYAEVTGKMFCADCIQLLSALRKQQTR